MRYDPESRMIETQSKREMLTVQKLALTGVDMGAIDPESHCSLRVQAGRMAVADRRMTTAIVGGLVMHARGEIAEDDAVVSESEARRFLIDNDLGRVYGYGKAGSDERFAYYREEYFARLAEDPALQAEAEEYAKSPRDQ